MVHFLWPHISKVNENRKVHVTSFSFHLFQIPNRRLGKAVSRVASSIRPKQPIPPSPAIKIDKIEPFQGGFRYFLESPVSTNQPRSEDAITYINKGARAWGSEMRRRSYEAMSINLNEFGNEA